MAGYKDEVIKSMFGAILVHICCDFSIKKALNQNVYLGSFFF
jgi:hypothetical protein